MAYKTDLSNKQWDFLKDLFPRQGKVGRPRVTEERTIVNGILYIVKTGCQWDMLPNDFPPKSTVFYHFQKWCCDGTWEKAMKRLTKLSRVQSGRHPNPSYGLIDSKSVPTANKAEAKGIDGGKKNQRQKTSHHH